MGQMQAGCASYCSLPLADFCHKNPLTDFRLRFNQPNFPGWVSARGIFGRFQAELIGSTYTMLLITRPATKMQDSTIIAPLKLRPYGAIEIRLLWKIGVIRCGGRSKRYWCYFWFMSGRKWITRHGFCNSFGTASRRWTRKASSYRGGIGRGTLDRREFYFR